MTVPLAADEWVSFERFGSIESREYRPGDEADPCISFSLADLNRTSLAGGRIARNPASHDDQWYIAPDYFAKHYRRVVDVTCETCRDTGEIDQTLGGIPTSDPHTPCPDCRPERGAGTRPCNSTNKGE